MKKILKRTAALLALLFVATSVAVPVSAAPMSTTPTTVYHVGDKTPVIDGVYSPDEGWGDPITTVTFDMTQEEGKYLSLCDASHPELMNDKDLIPSNVDVYMRWDEKALYYCAVVVQEKRWNGVGGGDNGDIWKNDSIIFNITNQDDDDDKSRAGVGINNDGDIAYGTFATQGGTYGFDNFQDWKVTRNEETKTTTYEIPFLWEEIMEDEKAPLTGGLKLRDLLMPTDAEDQVNPVDFNLSGIDGGKYKYWDITLSEETGGSAAGAEGKTVTVPRISGGAVTVDGERDALYDLCEPQAMTEQNLDYFSGSFEDSTGTFWALYDNGYIYLYVDIADEDIDYSNENPEQTWNRESIGVMFDFSYNRTPQYEYSYAGNGDKVCYINLSGDGVMVTYHMYDKDQNNGLFDQIEFKTVSPESGAGHILYEIACPIPEEIDVEEGGKFGLEVIATEALGGTRQGCVSWSPEGSEMWHYSDVLGTAIWGEKSGAEEEPEPVSKGFASLDEAAASIGRTPVTAYEFVEGSNGFGGEGPENLWDNSAETKFCTNETPIHSVVKLDGMYSVDGVIMATANDNAEYNGRSPYDWTIQGSTDGENWTTIKNGDATFFEEVNFTYFAEAVDPSPDYCYIRFVAEGAESEVFQVSEVVVTGTRTGDLPAEEPAEEPAAEEPAAEEIASPAVDETLDAKAEAPNTFDFGIAAAAAAVLSACGFAASKKKRG